MEIASHLKSKYKEAININVISMDSVPFERVLGKEVGEIFKQIGIKNGVNFIFGDAVVGVEAEDHKVKKLLTKNNQKVDVSNVILGIGVRPNSEYLNNNSHLLNNKDKSINVDSFLRTLDKDVFAAGDIANFP